MNVNELIEQLKSCDGEREVYTLGVGGDFRRVTSVEPDAPHEKLSIVPYEDENFVWIK